MEKISVILVDANEDFRGLLQEYMERDGAFTVLASVGDGMEALRAVRRLRPDLVVMDVVLPGLERVRPAFRDRAGTAGSARADPFCLDAGGESV